VASNKFELGQIVTERDEPYPMTGEIVSHSYRVGEPKENDKYGVRFDALKGDIAYVLADEIQLAW
jgi:hypothetical protein